MIKTFVCLFACREANGVLNQGLKKDTVFKVLMQIPVHLLGPNVMVCVYDFS